MPRNYNHNDGVPAFFSQGSSALIRTEFDKIQDGFTGVETEIDDLTAEVDLKEYKTEVALKAYHTGDTYTGTHDFSTADVIIQHPSAYMNPVTKLYADNLVFTNVLPDQTGNDGKWITTDAGYARWEVLPDPPLYHIARTSNTILTFADKATFFDITSGTFTQTFDSCANLGSSWWVTIRNSSTSGVVTLDPNGSETIDGEESFKMYPGETRLIQCNGSSLKSVVLSAFHLVVSESFTFYKPPGYSAFSVMLWSGGAGGSKYDTTNVTGGGGGGCAVFTMISDYVGSTNVCVIGDGGDGATSPSTDGTDGGDSYFLGVTVYGSPAGTDKYGTAYFPIATYAPRDEVSEGGQGSTTINLTAAIYGGGAGGGVKVSTENPGGESIFGGNGGDGSIASSGGDGYPPGGGGGGTKTGAKGGDGARGGMLIWGVA